MFINTTKTYRIDKLIKEIEGTHKKKKYKKREKTPAYPFKPKDTP